MARDPNSNQQQRHNQQTKEQDPREKGPKPPFPEQEQQPPGKSSEMKPQPDYGEDTYRGTGKLEGKKAIITGGDSGIGRAVALAYAREGADVLVSYLNEDDDAKETVRLVEESGRKAVSVAGDIGDEAHCQAVVKRAVDELGGLDILVNNAAFMMARDSIADTPSEEIEHTFRTNILAMFWFVKAALPHLKPGSSIINTTSIQAYEPTPSIMTYASTKGAIENFTKGLAKQLIEKGIRVNSVAPGPVWTPLIASGMPDRTSTFGQKIDPMERPAQPVELAPAYVFLASADANYVNGETLGVTGGMIMP